MRIYARVEGGIVVEIIPTYVDENDYEYPIEDMFTSEFVETLVEITDIDPQPEHNWTYTGNGFAPPVAPTIDPTPAVLARMTQIDTLSIKLLRKVAIGAITEQELDILEAFDEEYVILLNSL